MEVRKNVALDHKHVKMLQPLIMKHQGNFSAAIRELVELMDILQEKYGSIDMLRESSLVKKSRRDQYIEDHYGVVVPSQILHWLLKNRDIHVPPKQYLLFSLYSYLREQSDLDEKIHEHSADWERVLNEFYGDLGWPIDIRIRASNRVITVEVIGFDSKMNRLAFLITAMNLACGPVYYKIREVEDIQTAIFATFETCETENDALESITIFFGEPDTAISE
ncbi:MAG: hypothetical protein WBA22_00990 [Candidatus Methanofastidiosia archaeon]